MLALELARETKALCEASEGYEPYTEWRKRVATRMTPFVDSPAAG